MSEFTIRALAFLEYDFVQVDTDLGEIHNRLVGCSHEVPACQKAAEQLTKLRYALRSVLSKIDNEISAAIKAAEELEPAPF